ncbi:hypothetical protein ACPZ19_12030 [Amycolatopsis lurida]
MVALLAEAGDRLDVERTHLAVCRLPREDGPVLLYQLHRLELLEEGALAGVVGLVWAMAERPDAVLGHRRWLTLFTNAGYTHDGRTVPRPTTAMRLYRGAVPGRRADWSWTDSLEIARIYAEGRQVRRPPGQVWSALVPPDRMLARNDDRDEREFVVNTAGLTIARWPPA